MRVKEIEDLIILGDKYSFSEIEYSRLKKKFNSIIHISYKSKPFHNNIDKINEALEQSTQRVIVLNTQAPLEKELIVYLTKLELQNVKYITIEHFLETYLKKYFISEELSVNTAFLEEVSPYSKFQYAIKRSIDFIGIFLLFLPTLIFSLYTKFRMHKESPGSLYFEQKRVGLGGEEFNCIKLRSMHLNAEENGAKFAKEDDPRVYPWGDRIRYTKIDELGQLYNVLKGEMHLIGPRPERKIWTREFEKSIPYYAQRHVVAPGITGLAQLKYQYGRGKIDAKEKLMYDLYYIKNWSLKLELEIIWKTLVFLLTSKKEDLSNF